MKTILSTAALFLILSTGLAALLGLLGGTPPSSLPIEIFREPRTSFSEEALRAILETRNLRKADRPQLIVLGASGAQEAYRPADLQADLEPLGVNNLAIGAATLGEMHEVLDHCLKSLHRVRREGSALVLGLSYPLFVPEETRWRHPDFVSPAVVASGLYLSDLKRESMRNPLVMDSQNPVFRLLPGIAVAFGKWRSASWHEFAQAHPGHPADVLLAWKGWKWRLTQRHAGDRSYFPARQRPTPRKAPTPREQMAWLEAYMGTPPGEFRPEPFAAFTDLVGAARREGVAVVVLDMPLPSWHRAESPYVGTYRKQLAEALAAFGEDPGVSFVDLSTSAPDGEFRDSIHPTPESRAAWSGRLSRELRPRLGLAP